jgi:hypothetical protein
MFAGLTAKSFDDPEFKEDSVRELVILPMLNRLGYGPTSNPRVARSKTLKHPFIRIGTGNHPVTMVPDYTFLNDGKPVFVLDAKSPIENVLESKHLQQVYSYAVHPEIKCSEFGLCNGRRLVVFNVDKNEPLLDLGFLEYEAKWGMIERFLSPQFLLRPHLRRFSPDFGFKLKRLGITRDTDQVFIGVRLNLFAKISEELFTAAANCCFGDVDHCVSFDFPTKMLPEIVSGLPKPLQDDFCGALQKAPFQAAAGLVIEIDISVRLGEETNGSSGETFIPLVIQKVHGARFNPEEVEGDPHDIPDHVYQLRHHFAIKRSP